MKKQNLYLTATLSLMLAAGLLLAGCDTGNGGGGGGDGGGFSVSGSFTKSAEAGGGIVKFSLKSDDAFGRAAVTADSYTLTGALEDGDLTIRLRGNYNPESGNWTVSAKSSAIVYTLDGNVDDNGVSQSTTATVAVRSGEEWVPYVYPVTETAVTIPKAESAVASVSGGIPAFAQGNWKGTLDFGGGNTVALECLISEWKIKYTGTFPGDVRTPIEKSQTVLQCKSNGNGAYDLIVCYPEYTQTTETLAKAMAAHLGIQANAITQASSSSGNSGKWVYVSSSSVLYGGFTNAEYRKLGVFWDTGGWEKWASQNNVESENQYSAYRVIFTANNTKFDFIQMAAQEDEDNPSDYTLSFDSLEDLEDAELVEQHYWNWPQNGGGGNPSDGGVWAIPFTR